MPFIPHPEAGEYAPYYGKYIAQLPANADILMLLREQASATAKLLATAGESPAEHRYADGKWSVKEVVGHLSDAERVFSYRALWFARADPSELPGFDENAWIPVAGFGARTLADVAAELAAVRAATIALFASLDDAALLRSGRANAQPVSVRALAAILAGHERHHVTLLRERYGLAG